MLEVVNCFSVKKGFLTIELSQKREINPRDTGVVRIGEKRMNYIWEHNPKWISVRSDDNPESFIGSKVEFEVSLHGKR